jgi:15-cis-phytoene synthase
VDIATDGFANRETPLAVALLVEVAVNLSADAVEKSYQFCRRMSGNASSSFHASFLLLSHERRRAMESLYAFMRHTDDLTDSPQTGRPAGDRLAAWRAGVERAMLGVIAAGTDVGTLDPVAAIGGEILPSLVDAVRRFGIPPEHLYAVIEGVEMDLVRQRYETFDELRPYCERVASAVGLACIYIWGFKGPEAFEPARKCGIAMQLTNILRDVKEDVGLDRVYLPLADLRDCGYSVDDLRAGVADERYHRLMSLEIGRAEQFYREGIELMDWLAPPGRRMFGLMMATYRALLRKIAGQTDVVLRRRVGLSGPKRLRLAARWLLLPPRKVALR